MKILVLDDEPDMIVKGGAHQEGSLKWTAYVRELGVEVVFVTTPQAAEDRFQKEEFALLLLDGFLIFGQPGEKTVYGPDILADWMNRGLKLPPVYMISNDKEMCAKGIAVGAKGKADKALLYWAYTQVELDQNRQTLEALVRKE